MADATERFTATKDSILWHGTPEYERWKKEEEEEERREKEEEEEEERRRRRKKR